MIQTLTMNYDDNTIFEGAVREDDASFNHAFGCEKQSVLVLEDFHVSVYINGISYDVTKGLTDKTLNAFKSHFLDWADSKKRELE